MAQYNESLLKGNVMHSLIKFAIPVLLANILQIVYSTTDMIIVGRFATTADVAGVAIGSQIMALLTLGLSGICVGVTVVLGQRAGAKDERGLALATGTSIVFFIIVSVCAMLPLIALNKPIIAIMNTPPEAISNTRAYLLICSIGTPFIVGYNVISSFLRGLGNSKTPFIFVGVSCVINVALDYILVRWVHMGADGAAIATVVAQGGSLAFSLFYLKRRGLGFHMTRGDVRIDGSTLRAILKTGTPLALQEILIQFSFVLITAVVNEMGLTISASVGIVEKLICFLMMPASAMGSAVATMSSHNIGAQQLDRARGCMWAGVTLAIVAGAALHAFSQFGGAFMAGLFTDDADVIKNAALYLTTYTIDCLFVAVVFPMNSYFASCGHSVFTMLQSLATTFAIRVPAVILLARLPGVTLQIIGIAAPITSVGSIVISLIFYFRLKRREAAVCV